MIKILATVVVFSALAAVGYLFFVGGITTVSTNAERQIVDQQHSSPQIHSQPSNAIDQDVSVLTPDQLMELKPIAALQGQTDASRSSSSSTDASSLPSNTPSLNNSLFYTPSGVDKPAATGTRLPTGANTGSTAPAANRVKQNASAQALSLQKITTFKPGVLPPLNNSDGAIKKSLLTLDAQGLLIGWLVDEELIRKFVVMVDNIARGQIPRKHAVIRPLTDSFRAVEQGEQLVLSGYNFSRYRPYVGLFVSLNPDRLSALYQDYYPLMQQAYGELGYPRRSFHQRVLLAIDHLLVSPVVNEQLMLLRPSVMFKFADERFEKRSDVHKQMMRMGPENTRKVKQQLLLIRSRLTQLIHA